MNFVFYDIEATGPEPCYDQMLHVAGVLADGELNELDCFSKRCRLKPHMLPSPAALIITGLSMPDVTSRTLPSHFETVSVARERLLSWSPAVFAGYSSLEFDEILLSGALRSCLYASDLTTSGGNSRIDVQRLVLAVNAFAPGAIAFTQRHDGYPSFRLSEVARANGIGHEQAHDALADVRTTLAVARLIESRVPWLWRHATAMGRVDEAVSFARAEPVRLYTEFNHNRLHHWLVSAISRNVDKRGELLAFNLSRDPEEGRTLEGEALLGWLRSQPKPLRPIKARDCPLLLPRARAGAIADLGVDGRELDRRAALLREDSSYRERLNTAHERLQKDEEVLDEKAAGAAFHEAAWEERARQLRGIADEGLRNRAERLILDEQPEFLDADVRARLESAQAIRMLRQDKVTWMTLAKAFELTDAAFEHATSEDAGRLEGLLAYLRSELSWAERTANASRDVAHGASERPVPGHKPA